MIEYKKRGENMKNRSEARDAVIKILYKINILEEANVEIEKECPIQNDFVTSLIDGILKNKDQLDATANKYLIDWELTRLNKVDQAIFRMSIYELKYTSTPSVVAINEAIELSKKYSEEKVTKMLNGVLDQIYHNEEANNE